MFRHIVHADAGTDVGAEVERLRVAAQAAGLPSNDVTLIAAGAEATLSDLIGRGRQLAGVGTTLSFERTLKGERYEVRLSFGSRGASSLWQRFHAAIRGS